jgi:hypothetical protein
MSATATPVAAVEAEAALELVRLLAGELGRLAGDWPAEQPYLIGQLLAPLGSIARRGVLRADDAAWLRDARYWGRRCDAVKAFQRLNPGFGPVHNGCWEAEIVPHDVERQTIAQRRELELSMGERFARMLAPAQGGAVR